VTTLSIFAIPGLAGLLAIPAARRAVITKEQLEQVASGVAALKADPQAQVADPISGGQVQRASHAPLEVLRDHFTPSEWARYAQGGSAAGMCRLRRRLGTRLSLWALLFVGFVVADVVAARLAPRAISETLLQITGTLLTAFVVGVPLDVLRFRAAGGGVEGKVAPMITKMAPSSSTSGTHVADHDL